MIKVRKFICHASKFAWQSLSYFYNHYYFLPHCHFDMDYERVEIRIFSPPVLIGHNVKVSRIWYISKFAWANLKPQFILFLFISLIPLYLFRHQRGRNNPSIPHYHHSMRYLKRKMQRYKQHDPGIFLGACYSFRLRSHCSVFVSIRFC